MRDQERLKKRDKDLRKFFDRLHDKRTDKGVRVHSEEYCIEKTADKFYLSESTVKKVVNTPEAD